MNELVANEWYQSLVDDCKAIVTEAVFTSRWALVEGYWNLGKRIREEDGLKKWSQNEAGRVLQDLANLIGISSRTIHYALQAYDKYPEIGNIPEGKNITWNKLITKYLPERKIETPPIPIQIVKTENGEEIVKYNVIYADPPWDVKAGPDWGSGEESKDLLYPTMSLGEIAALPVDKLAADNSHLYLWTINKYIKETYDIARAWGFEPSTLLTWCKPKHGIGLGGTFIQTTEHLLFCRKGTLNANKRIDTTWFEYPRGRHSEKPDEFRKMIEEVSPGNKIELFARIKSEGWDVWGNEV
jgi:N6-adenosine-specific RNA methylase IME4